MKKLFTLLTLALLSIGSAWATNTTLIDGYTLADLPTSALDLKTQTTFTTTDCVDANGNIVIAPIYWNYGSAASYAECPMKGATWFSANDFSNTGEDWTAPDGSVFKGSANWGNGFARRLNVRNTARNYAIRFKGCGGISILGFSNASGKHLYLSVYKINAGEIGDFVETASVVGNTQGIATVSDLSSSIEYVAYIYNETGTNGSLQEIALLAPTTDPIITAAATTIETTTSGVDVTKDIDITGANLTANGTLTATLSPAVVGLSVALASNAIDASGAISTTATLTYNTTANAKGTTTLVLSDGTTVKNVTITYNSTVVSWTLQSISSATTWDWSKLTANTENELYVSKDKGIKLTDSSTPSVSTEFVMENYAGGDLYTIADGFDGTSIAFTGQYPIRNNQFCQAGTVKFNTTVPGTIVVKFSDTGSSASATAVKRYLKVNGENTEYWTSRQNNSSDPEVAYAAQMNVVSGEIAVPAGDVTITGSSAIQIYYVTFTPSVPVTIAASGYSSLASAYGLNFAGATPAGLEAYVASAVTASGVTLNAVTEAPASTGIILKGTPGATYTIPVKTDAAAIAGTNYLHAAVAAYDCEANEVYILKGGKFCLVTAASTVPAGKAYLLASDVPASAPELEFNFGGTTGINAVNGSEFKVNGEYYNLAGQRVAQPTKGLYIVNGRKVVIK